MIHSIHIENFKSLSKVDLTLGHLNLMIGTNASGKSNFLDALRVLQGLGYGFTIDEVLNGKPKSSNSETWEGIRGGSAKARYVGRHQTPPPDGEDLVTLIVKIGDATPKNRITEYGISFSPSRGIVRKEWLISGESKVFDSRDLDNPANDPVLKVQYQHGKKGTQPHLSFEKVRPVLHQLVTQNKFNEQHKKIVQACIDALSNTQRIDPVPAKLREYSTAQSVRRMGERGENFAALVKVLLKDDKSHQAFVSWLKELTPAEVEDVKVLDGAVGDSLFALREGGADQPATILSDGTLRFAAITASFFQPDMPSFLTFEEIENGIHPTRLRLLVELLRKQSGKHRQLLATTHSPIVLAWLKEDEYPWAFFCQRNEETGESSITPLSDIPGFEELVARQPIGELFAEGWLEGAL